MTDEDERKVKPALLVLMLLSSRTVMTDERKVRPY
jgi:hypothetical protein